MNQQLFLRTEYESNPHGPLKHVSGLRLSAYPTRTEAFVGKRIIEMSGFSPGLGLTTMRVAEVPTRVEMSGELRWTFTDPTEIEADSFDDLVGKRAIFAAGIVRITETTSGPFASIGYEITPAQLVADEVLNFGAHGATLLIANQEQDVESSSGGISLDPERLTGTVEVRGPVPSTGSAELRVDQWVISSTQTITFSGFRDGCLID